MLFRSGGGGVQREGGEEGTDLSGTNDMGAAVPVATSLQCQQTGVKQHDITTGGHLQT